MEGTIEPDKSLFEKFNSVGEAPRLSVKLDDEESARLFVVSNMVNALIVSGQKFSGDDALIQRAISLSEKILKKVKKS